jgi:NADH dehydrogenase (ubiquinone) 1 alpha subcomplex subunit 13
MLTDNLSSSELAREKMWSRIHLIPVLQAEEDRDLVRRHWAEQAREKELMGAETKVYNNDRYDPTASKMPRDWVDALGANSRTDSCVPHTQSHPRRLRSKRGPIEPGIKAKGQESHVVNIAGSGAFFHVGNHRPMTVSNVHSNVNIEVLAR